MAERESWTEALSLRELDFIRDLVLCSGDIDALAEYSGEPVDEVRRRLDWITATVAATGAAPDPSLTVRAARAGFPGEVVDRIAEIYRRVLDERP